MSPWWNFGRKPRTAERVTSGRFEMEREGEVAYLEYTLSGNVLGLIHTEVPQKLRGHGLSSALAETALNWAREHRYKVDIVCPSVQDFVDTHPQYKDLIIR